MSVDNESFVVLENDELNEYKDIEEGGDKEEGIYYELGSVESVVKSAPGDAVFPEDEPGQDHGDLEGKKEPKVEVLIPGLDGAGENNIVTMIESEYLSECDISHGDVTAKWEEGSLVQVKKTEEEGKECLDLVPVVTDVELYGDADAEHNGEHDATALVYDSDVLCARMQAIRDTMKELKERLDEVKESVKCEAQMYPELGMYVDMTSACAGDVDAVADRNSRYEMALAEVRASAQKTREASLRAQMYMDKVMQVEKMCEVEFSTLEKTSERVSELSKSVCDWSVNGGKWTVSGAVEEPVSAGARSKIDEAPSGYSVSYRKPNLLPGSSGMLALSDSSSLSLAPKSYMDLVASSAYTPRANDFMADFTNKEINIGDTNMAEDFKQKIMRLNAELNDSTSPRKSLAERRLSELTYTRMDLN